jgi:hypothetical protein
MESPLEFNLVGRGLAYRLAQRIGIGHPDRPRRIRKVLLLVLVTWLPLVLLSLAAGHAIGDRVEVALVRDPVILSRFLFVVPLLALAEVAVERSLRVQVLYFVESGIVPKREAPKLEAAKGEAHRLRESIFVDGVMIALALATPIFARVLIESPPGESTWERSGTQISLAGWWYILVSLPILMLYFLRWLWIFVLWGWFLFRVSRLDLQLTPTHPDRAGGLGFLGWGLACFALVLMAVSAVLSGSFAYEIVHRGSSLDNLKYHLIVFLVLALVVLHAPLLSFAGRLGRCRFRGLLEFGALIGEHDRAFEQKWIKSPNADQAGILGSPDVSSMSNIDSVYAHIERMQLLPFDRKAVAVMVAAALIPMIPLLGTSIGLTQILSMLGKFMI